VRSIGHKDVRDFYGQDFLERQRRLFAPPEHAPRSGGPWRPGAGRRGRRGRAWDEPSFLKTGPALPHAAAQRNERNLVKGLFAALLNHPVLIEEYHEGLSGLGLAERDLDLLRTAIVNISAGYPGLDATAFQAHLAQCGHAAILSQILHSDVYSLYRSSQPHAALETVRAQCDHLFARLGDRHLAEELRQAQEEAVAAGTSEAVDRADALLARRVEDSEADT